MEQNRSWNKERRECNLLLLLFLTLNVRRGNNVFLIKLDLSNWITVDA